MASQAVENQPSASDHKPEILAIDHEAMLASLLPVDPGLETREQTHRTWRISNWTTLQKKEYGPKFECGGSTWQLFLYPKGNNVDFVSVYLRSGNDEEKISEDWSACAHFAVMLWNPRKPTQHTSKVAKHRFNADSWDWGFTKFCELPKETPLLSINEEVCITVYIRLIKDPTGVLWHDFINYNSKKVTGMVGLKNEGATGYLNVVLQILYFTNAFRKAVYKVPLGGEADRTTLLGQLQRLFYSLQSSGTTVSALELTKSMGWRTAQLFQQEDVQEMLHILVDRLDTATKSSQAGDILPNLLCGTIENYVTLPNDTRHASSRTEIFWDLDLDVFGISSLEDSLRDFIRPSDTTDETGAPCKYGHIITNFPPVLHIRLKRFTYEPWRQTMIKIDDYVKFPEEFDAAPYLSSTADFSESWHYTLVGVVVHSGGISEGRYWLFLRPKASGRFYRFDDHRVIPATLKEAVDDNFGQRGQPTSAYMLIYIRKSRLDEVMVDVTDDDVPSYLKQSRETVLSMRARPDARKQ